MLQRLAAWFRAHFPPLVKHDESLVMLLVLGGVYFLVFLMSLTQLLRTHYRLNKSITKQKLFFIFTAFCALVRARASRRRIPPTRPRPAPERAC